MPCHVFGARLWKSRAVLKREFPVGGMEHSLPTEVCNLAKSMLELQSSHWHLELLRCSSPCGWWEIPPLVQLRAGWAPGLEFEPQISLLSPWTPLSSARMCGQTPARHKQGNCLTALHVSEGANPLKREG